MVISRGSSSINGVISDSDGPVGPSVTVIARRVVQEPGPARVTQTDENGHFSLTGLPAGEYRLIAMDIGVGLLLPEFSEKLGKPVTVAEGATASANIRLTTIDDLRAVR
jgi:hypothetical protein